MNIPYGKQSINQTDIDSVINVLKSDFLTQGPQVPLFEKTMASYCQVDYAIAVCNATAALHLACRALDITSQDIVWTSPNSFVASANCALYCGATIDFIDINPNTYNISIEALKTKLIHAQQSNSLPKAIIAVHFSGRSCQMQEIKALSEQYHFNIVEDASHAIGAEYLGNKVGSCQYSDISIFSFHPVKIMTTAEGGMLLTQSKQIADKLKLLRNGGITKEQEQMVKESDGPWYYQQLDLGYNYRLNDLQAALGIAQFQRLDHFLQRRRILAESYHLALQHLPLQLPQFDTKIEDKSSTSSWHLYVIRLKLNELKHTKKVIFQQLRDLGVGVHVHYIPIHLQPYYKQLGFKPSDFPEAEQYYQEALTLPLFYDMTDKEQQYIITSLTKILT